MKQPRTWRLPAGVGSSSARYSWQPPTTASPATAIRSHTADRWSTGRGGLYANVTRMVHFEEPDAELKRRHEACEVILGRMREEATRPGYTLADAFADCQRFYAEAGFPDEWKLHHQGGMTGYASREVIATPHTEQQIRVGQAFAWNPSITGAKAEETFILTEDGPEVITLLEEGGP